MEAHVALTSWPSGRARRPTQVGLTPKPRFLPPHPLVFVLVSTRSTLMTPSPHPLHWPGSWLSIGINECIWDGSVGERNKGTVKGVNLEAGPWSLFMCAPCPVFRLWR